MTDQHGADSGDQYRSLGLTVLAKHEMPGLQAIVSNLRDTSRKVKVIQLVTALALLIFIVTDMLPTVAVAVSGLVVLIAATVAGRKATVSSVTDAGALLEMADFAGSGEIVNTVSSDTVFLKDLVESGVASIGQDVVVNVDGDFIVVCAKPSEKSAS